MKFPLHSHTWHDTSIREDDGTPVAHCATTSIRDELIRRANAFDELLATLTRARDELDRMASCGDSIWPERHELSAVIAKYGDRVRRAQRRRTRTLDQH
jgi:hypothetical protein